MATVLESLSRAMPELRRSDDEADRVAYARDLWPRHHLAVRAGRSFAQRPAGVVWPTSTEEVARIVRWASETGTAVVPFGAGSGVCAGVLPREDVVVIDLKRMRTWRALDPVGRTLDVEAGHMGLPLEEELERRGLTLGHFPSSILCSTVGGWVAARSAGQCSGKYGKIEDMVLALECVTGRGDVVQARSRTSGPNLVPLIVGSEGTLAVVTSATLRLHAAPKTRAFAAFSFPTTEHGWEAMRALFQAGLRPAVARLYDPFDAMLARQGGVKRSTATRSSERDREPETSVPGLGGRALRAVLKRPALLNELLEGRIPSAILGGSLVVLVFEGDGDGPRQDAEAARTLCERMKGRYDGEGPARKWLAHRYAVSYRQAPLFAAGLFVDTMEVAAPWSKLGALYDGVRRALGEHVFVMAHMSHAYPDGCCIYFSFAGTAARGAGGAGGGLSEPGRDDGSDWEERCEATYDRAWQAAMAAAIEAGGTLSHHHGVGRSKAPRMREELGEGGVAVVRALCRAFDPAGVLNPGNLLPPRDDRKPGAHEPIDDRAEGDGAAPALPSLDATSLLVDIRGSSRLDEVRRFVEAAGYVLPVATSALSEHGAMTVDAWLAAGAPGAVSAFADPADHLLAGLEVTLLGRGHGARGGRLVVRPGPRRAVGPDLTALVVGARGHLAVVDRAWLRVHRSDARRPELPLPAGDLDPPVSVPEAALMDHIANELTRDAPP